MLVEKFPFDKYELEASPLTQYILARRNAGICWQVGPQSVCGLRGGVSYQPSEGREPVVNELLRGVVCCHGHGLLLSE